MFSRWQLDLVLAGWSIAYKGQVLRREWESHLRNTKQFLSDSLNGGSNLHVLGAGRLLDFPLSRLLPKYSKIELYDGDRGAIRKYSRLSKLDPRIEGHEVEISGRLAEFRSVLAKHKILDGLFAHPDFLEFSENPHFLKLSSESHLISLNLLSQLPLAYRQIFERWIIKNYGRKFHQNNEIEWLKEYCILGQEIIRSHINLLLQSGAKRIVIITDVEQIFYPVDILQLPEPQMAPFKWGVDLADSKPLEVTSSICDVDLLQEIECNYQITSKAFWPWHLTKAKKGEPGVVCKVEALCLER